MIKLFNLTDTLFSSNGDKIIIPTKAKIHKEDNGAYYLDLETNLSYVNDIVQDKIIVAPTPQGEQAFRIGNVEKTKSKLKSKCYHIYYDSENYLISDSYVVDKDCNDALDHLNSATDNTSPSNAKYFRLSVIIKTDNPNYNLNICMLEQDLTPTTYEPYKSQTYPINLGSIELCKIGTYQDRIYKSNGNWYLHKEIGKVVLNGSANTELYGNGGTATNYWECFRTSFVGGNGSQTNVKTNYFNQTESSRVVIINNGTLYLRFPKASGIDISTNTLMNNWLSTHNTTVYYVLATPTTTQITDQLLVSQLDELQKAMSYYDKTLITQTNADKPFILDVVGIRDLQDIFNIINQ